MRGVKGQRSDRRAPGGTESAGCVRNLDDSPIVAIRITYRISLRSSSAQEPRHPSLKVVSGLYCVFLIPFHKKKKKRKNSDKEPFFFFFFKERNKKNLLK
jgi:hypothetical protein